MENCSTMNDYTLEELNNLHARLQAAQANLIKLQQNGRSETESSVFQHHEAADVRGNTAINSYREEGSSLATQHSLVDTQRLLDAKWKEVKAKQGYLRLKEIRLELQRKAIADDAANNIITDNVSPNVASRIVALEVVLSQKEKQLALARASITDLTNKIVQQNEYRNVTLSKNMEEKQTMQQKLIERDEMIESLKADLNKLKEKPPSLLQQTPEGFFPTAAANTGKKSLKRGSDPLRSATSPGRQGVEITNLPDGNVEVQGVLLEGQQIVTTIDGELRVMQKPTTVPSARSVTQPTPTNATLTQAASTSSVDPLHIDRPQLPVTEARGLSQLVATLGIEHPGGQRVTVVPVKHLRKQTFARPTDRSTSLGLSTVEHHILIDLDADEGDESIDVPMFEGAAEDDEHPVFIVPNTDFQMPSESFYETTDEMVSSFLPKTAAANIISARKQWAAILGDKKLWTRLDFSGKTLCSDALKLVFHRNTRVLRLQETKLKDPLFRGICPPSTLQFLDLTDAVISEEGLASLLFRCTGLRNLSLHGCHVSVEVCKKITRMNRLEVLDLSGCTGLDHLGMEAITSVCYSLTELSVEGASLSESTIMSLCSTITTKIQRLNLSLLRELHGGHLMRLKPRCPELVDLEIAALLDCFNLNVLCSFPHLERLCLSWINEDFKWTILKALPHMPCLQVLDMFQPDDRPQVMSEEIDLIDLQMGLPRLKVSMIEHLRIARPSVDGKIMWGQNVSKLA